MKVGYQHELDLEQCRIRQYVTGPEVVNASP
jgi:hypothetical protein